MDHKRPLQTAFKFTVEQADNGTFIASVVHETHKRQSDDVGALYYVIVVIMIYGCSILMMIASYIRKNKIDQKMNRYLKEMANVRKREQQLQLFNAAAKAKAAEHNDASHDHTKLEKKISNVSDISGEVGSGSENNLSRSRDSDGDDTASDTPLNGEHHHQRRVSYGQTESDYDNSSICTDDYSTSPVRKQFLNIKPPPSILKTSERNKGYNDRLLTVPLPLKSPMKQMSCKKGAYYSKCREKHTASAIAVAAVNAQKSIVMVPLLQNVPPLKKSATKTKVRQEAELPEPNSDDKDFQVISTV